MMSCSCGSYFIHGHIILMAITLLTEIPMPLIKQKTKTFLVHQNTILLEKPDKIAIRVFFRHMSCRLSLVTLNVQHSSPILNFVYMLHSSYKPVFSSRVENN